eukprot:2836979-Prymnesium_polylepis.1
MPSWLTADADDFKASAGAIASGFSTLSAGVGGILGSATSRLINRVLPAIRRRRTCGTGATDPMSRTMYAKSTSDFFRSSSS